MDFGDGAWRAKAIANCADHRRYRGDIALGLPDLEYVLQRSGIRIDFLASELEDAFGS